MRSGIVASSRVRGAAGVGFTLLGHQRSIVNGESNRIDVERPAVSAGERIVVVTCLNAGQGAAMEDATTGWTTHQEAWGGNCSVGIFSKVADGSEPPTYGFIRRQAAGGDIVATNSDITAECFVIPHTGTIMASAGGTSSATNCTSSTVSPASDSYLLHIWTHTNGYGSLLIAWLGEPSPSVDLFVPHESGGAVGRASIAIAVESVSSGATTARTREFRQLPSTLRSTAQRGAALAIEV